MRGLSDDIEIAIKDSIEGMNLSVNILDVDDDKLANLMKSRLESFSATKEMIKLWQLTQWVPLTNVFLSVRCRWAYESRSTNGGSKSRLSFCP